MSGRLFGGPATQRSCVLRLPSFAVVQLPLAWQLAKKAGLR
jgi:hypothetical protein